MIYSGVDLIRTSNDQSQRLERLSMVESAAPTSDQGTNADSETMDALRRFARFVRDETTGQGEDEAPKDDSKDEEKPAVQKPHLALLTYQIEPTTRRSLPIWVVAATYQAQQENPTAETGVGTMFKVSV